MSIKRNVLAAGLVASSMLFAGAANAAWNDTILDDMYVGLDIGKVFIDYKTYKNVDYDDVYASSLSGINPWVGYQFHPSFAVELGYLDTGAKDRVVSATSSDFLNMTGNSTTEVKSWYLDGVADYALMDNVALIGAIGLERISLDISDQILAPSSVTIKRSDTNTSIRVSLGMKYNFNDQVAARVIGRASNADFGGIASYVGHIGVGLSYDF